ncbi:hypothetical protein K474DRAFT_1714171 [Panus rudis PR-1116 ss-1]|nr:hypothetical protein K474DRAFT_1714171 [Panus rudis PR-1116 ss-1]
MLSGLRSANPPRQYLHGSLAKHYSQAEQGVRPIEVVVAAAREPHFGGNPDTVLVTVLDCPQNADVRLALGMKVKTSEVLIGKRDFSTGQIYLVPARVVGDIMEVASVEVGAVIWKLSNDAPEWISTVYIYTPRRLCYLDSVDDHGYMNRQRELKLDRKRYSQNGTTSSLSRPSSISVSALRLDREGICIPTVGQGEPMIRGGFYSPHGTRPLQVLQRFPLLPIIMQTATTSPAFHDADTQQANLAATLNQLYTMVAQNPAHLATLNANMGFLPGAATPPNPLNLLGGAALHASVAPSQLAAPINNWAPANGIVPTAEETATVPANVLANNVQVAAGATATVPVRPHN